ncbi:MAG: glycoside hydrolase family 65 protein [Nostocoides sp.]
MKSGHIDTDPLDRTRFTVDPWRLVEREPVMHDVGVTETLFAVANGYIGMRGNPEEGRQVYEHGTFINGFHETWPIHHAESAYGFAKTGQTIVNAPDAKLLKISVDDEPLVVGISDLLSYERSLDFRDGILRRDLVWRTPSGKKVQVTTTRMVSMAQRHLAVMTLEVTMLSGDAPVMISSQLLNRQDGEDEYHVPAQALQHKDATNDPRKAPSFDERVLLPRRHDAEGDRLDLGYKCAHSGMTVAVQARHRVSTEADLISQASTEADRSRLTLTGQLHQGQSVRVEKLAAYHTSRTLPVDELADRCARTLDRFDEVPMAALHAEQRDWFDIYWAGGDVELDSAHPHTPAIQQAIRFNLFTIAQASARADTVGVPAKGMTGSGYEGHYFWDSEVYVAPYLTYTQPEAARNLLTFRSRMLPKARDRAMELSQNGALFPWRTINGEEASAYYAAGTAQVHIDADVAFALTQFVNATDDVDFLVRHGLAILVETARLYADLGFWRENGAGSFHIHSVTGPDEYTAVVNNNLFTNVMARFNLERAAAAVERVRAEFPDDFARLKHQLRLREAEVTEWKGCAAAMHIPYDERLGIHPQDDAFLDREVWDLSRTPDSVRPLLLHYHPLVIYRFQVLKQADVVLALFLQGDRFSAAQKKADFDYYDPITTGDSTLSAVVQSVMAAEVGYHRMARQYFLKALYVDLANLHGNTVDGVHVASAGGVWTALVNGFGGMRDSDGNLRFDPRLPQDWDGLTWRLRWRGTRVRVELSQQTMTFTVEEGSGKIPISVRGTDYLVGPDAPTVVTLDGQGPVIDDEPNPFPWVGAVRADGSLITAGVPDPSPFADVEPSDLEF